MEKNFQHLKARYEKKISKLYLKTKFNPNTDFTFLIRGYPFGSYNGNLYFEKGIIFDCDGVFNSKEDDDVFTHWFHELGSLYTKIQNRAKDIEKCIDDIKAKRNFKEGITRFAKILSGYNIKKEKYLEASIEAANKVKLTKNTLSLMSELYSMGYVPAITSGSPQEVLEFFGTNRLGIPKESIYGTSFEFDKKNRITDRSHHGLGTNKVENKSKFLDSIYCPKYFTVTISDDKNLDFELGVDCGLGLMIWVGKENIPKILQKAGYSISEKVKILKDYFRRNSEIEKTLKIECLEARENLEALISPIKKWERLKIVMSLFDPRMLRNLVFEIENLERSAEKYIKHKNDKDLYYFRKKTQKTLSILGPIFPSVSCNIDKILDEINKEYKNNKNVIDDILYRMKMYIPEFQKTKKYIADLDEIIDEWEKYFSNDEWW